MRRIRTVVQALVGITAVAGGLVVAAAAHAITIPVVCGVNALVAAVDLADTTPIPDSTGVAFTNSSLSGNTPLLGDGGAVHNGVGGTSTAGRHHGHHRSTHHRQRPQQLHRLTAARGPHTVSSDN